MCISGDDHEDEDDDELLKRTGNYIDASDALPKGIVKVCVEKCIHDAYKAVSYWLALFDDVILLS